MTSATAVWDFTTGDERRFRDRLELILDAAGDFGRRHIACDFVVLLHGGSTQFAARTLAGTKFDAVDLTAAHDLMRRFREAGGTIKVCGIAMERSGITADNLVDCVEVERNVFVTSVALQNRGYA